MAHFAQLDENNVVVNVLVVDNNDIQNLPFPESEAVGAAYLNSFLPPANYVQTSYNSNFRQRYAGVGFVFKSDWGAHGGFHEPQPYPSWTLNLDTLEWQPPTPMPPTGYHVWNEETKVWVQVIGTITPTIIG